MRRFSTRWLVYPSVVVLAVAMIYAHPEQQVHADSSSIVNWDCDDPELNRLREYLDVRHKIVTERMAYKEVLMKELVDGRATLKQVASEFLRVNSEDESAIVSIRTHFEGATDEEKSARNVIHHLRSRSIPEQQQNEVLTRVEIEFRTMYNASSENKLHMR